MLAALAAIGPSWTARSGVAVAVLAAVLACLFAWRELFWERRQHHRAMLAAAWAHGEALTEERTRNAGVVDALNGRLGNAGTLIERQRVTIAELKIKISSLQGDTVYFEGEVAHREQVIAALRETVRAREAELITLRDEDDAEVHHMPKRVLAEHESVWAEMPEPRRPVDRRLGPDGGRPEDARDGHGVAQLRGRTRGRLEARCAPEPVEGAQPRHLSMSPTT